MLLKLDREGLSISNKEYLLIRRMRKRVTAVVELGPTWPAVRDWLLVSVVQPVLGV